MDLSCLLIPVPFDPTTREGAFLVLACDDSVFDDFTIPSSDVPRQVSELMYVEDGLPMQTTKRKPVVTVPDEEAPAGPSTRISKAKPVTTPASKPKAAASVEVRRVAVPKKKQPEETVPDPSDFVGESEVGEADAEESEFDPPDSALPPKTRMFLS